MTTFPAPATKQVRTPACFHCGETSLVEVPTDGFHAWQSGTLIQRAFPEMPADTRELLISGTHPACWDAMFAEEED